jgi:chorismate synthase
MSGNTFGTLFTVTSFGESHGPAIGCVVDGCPPGLALCAADIQAELDRRKPGTSRHVTQRREPDAVEILSGVFEGKTTGTPIGLLIRNQDQRSKDYGNIADTFRPGHADYTYTQKYGFRDYRGGGRSSARETAVRVAAGAIARKWLQGALSGQHSWLDERARADRDSLRQRRRYRWQCLFCAQCGAGAATRNLHGQPAQVAGFGRCQDHVAATGVPPGWGEPVYDRLDAEIAYAMMGINAVKGVEIGAGFASVAQRGSEHGDEMTPQGFASNHAGGILGGISTGQEIVVNMAIKPTSSIAQPRRSIDRHGEAIEVATEGRHDPCVGIRATPIAEAMLALVLIDHALRHRAQCADVVSTTPRIPGKIA